MKKIKCFIMALSAILLIAFSSCANKHYGDYGVVESVTISDKTDYKYCVGVRIGTNNTWGYYFTTNRNYRVGDTIEFVGNYKNN